MRRFFFCASKNKRSATERAKNAHHSSQSDGGLYGIEREKTIFYTYILRSISQLEQRYIGRDKVISFLDPGGMLSPSGVRSCRKSGLQ